jgi:hypothetical protein
MASFDYIGSPLRAREPRRRRDAGRVGFLRGVGATPPLAEEREPGAAVTSEAALAVDLALEDAR